MDGRALYSLATPGQDSPTVLESRSSAPAQWQAPEPSRLDDLIYSMQDKRVDLKRVVQSIKKSAGSIADNIDPYLQEELFHGRAAKAVKDFLDLELRPLIAKMRMRGVEMAGEEQAFASEGAPRLAPNGKPSKLNAHQWKQVRTPEFKAWFGDWEAAAALQHLKTHVVATVSGREFGSNFSGEPVDMRALRHAAKEWAKAHIVGKFSNERSGLALEVRAKGIDDATQHGGAADKLRALSAIPELIREGVVVYDGKNPKNPQGRLVVIAGRMKISGRDLYVTAGFRADANGRLFYDHELMELEGAERLSSQWGAADEVEHPLPPAHLNDFTRRFLGQDVQASKVVDENGEPLVVYHGTMADCSEFGPKRPWQNFDDGNGRDGNGRGIHFSSNLDEPNSMAWRAGGLGLEPLDDLCRDG